MMIVNSFYAQVSNNRQEEVLNSGAKNIQRIRSLHAYPQHLRTGFGFDAMYQRDHHLS
jgi:hypothetical protein